MLFMKKELISLIENVLHNIINESIKPILIESQESKSEHQAVRLMMNRFGYSKEQAYEFVHKTIRQEIDSLKDKELGKFILGVTRMYCNGELNDASKINNLNSTLKLMKPHLNEYDRNLNGMSASDLINRFQKVRNNKIKTEKDEINQMVFDKSNYRIVPINSYEEAEQYNRYCYQDDQWCLTYMEEMYDSYTCNGINQIYFCLRNGFENVKPIVGKGCPLDEYGLSMISVIVNEKR